jgi:hypothetical protein
VNCPIAVLSALAYDPLFRARTLGCEASLAQPCQSRGASGRLQRISDFTKAILIRVAEDSQSPYQTKSFDALQEAIKTALLFKWIRKAKWKPFRTVGCSAKRY